MKTRSKPKTLLLAGLLALAIPAVADNYWSTINPTLPPLPFAPDNAVVQEITPGNWIYDDSPPAVFAESMQKAMQTQTYVEPPPVPGGTNNIGGPDLVNTNAWLGMWIKGLLCPTNGMTTNNHPVGRRPLGYQITCAVEGTIHAHVPRDWEGWTKVHPGDTVKVWSQRQCTNHGNATWAHFAIAYYYTNTYGQFVTNMALATTTNTGNVGTWTLPSDTTMRNVVAEANCLEIFFDANSTNSLDPVFICNCGTNWIAGSCVLWHNLPAWTNNPTGPWTTNNGPPIHIEYPVTTGHWPDDVPYDVCSVWTISVPREFPWTPPYDPHPYIPIKPRPVRYPDQGWPYTNIIGIPTLDEVTPKVRTHFMRFRGAPGTYDLETKAGNGAWDLGGTNIVMLDINPTNAVWTNNTWVWNFRTYHSPQLGWFLDPSNPSLTNSVTQVTNVVIGTNGMTVLLIAEDGRVVNRQYRTRSK